MIGVELQTADAWPTPWPRAATSAGLLVLECGEKAIRLSPPLIITEAQARDRRPHLRRGLPGRRMTAGGHRPEPLAARQGAAGLLHLDRPARRRRRWRSSAAAGRRFRTADGARLAGLRQHGLERQPRARPPGDAAGAGGGGRARAAGHARRRCSRTSCAAAERLLEVAPRGLRDGQGVLLPVGRRGQRERGEDGAPGDRPAQDRLPQPQLPRRHPGHAVALGRSRGARRSIPGCPAACPGTIPTRPRPTPATWRRCCGARGRTRWPRCCWRGWSAPTACSCRRPATSGASAQICDRRGVLFIADEVLSGFGRTGRWFAVDHDDVVARPAHLRQGADRRLRARRAR